MEAGYTAQHRSMPRSAPPQGDAVPNVSGAEVERPWAGRGMEPGSLVLVLVP